MGIVVQKNRPNPKWVNKIITGDVLITQSNTRYICNGTTDITLTIKENIPDDFTIIVIGGTIGFDIVGTTSFNFLYNGVLVNKYNGIAGSNIEIKRDDVGNIYASDGTNISH